jgi:glycosyltransferase involved in cell wall biosynthesis
MDEALAKIAVLIPAYNPGPLLLDLLRQLAATPIARIIVVNDGSDLSSQEVFSQTQTIPNVYLLVHQHNQGKGAALKTGLRYLQALPEPVAGVVTADADGQHALSDILAIARQIPEHPNALILGGRRFDKDVPWKSMAGNTITRWVLRLFFGLWIFDSQTGLRGIPSALIPHFLDIPYDRYEYEQEMLMLCSRRGIPIHEVTIRTIYIDQNRASHFNPFKDSARVYFILFRFSIAWLLTWSVDFIFFAFTIRLLPGILLPLLLARLAALGVLYPFWAYLVFMRKDLYSIQGMQRFYPRFALTATGLGLISASLVTLLQAQSGGSLIETKAIVEIVILFLFTLLPKSLKRVILPV